VETLFLESFEGAFLGFSFLSLDDSLGASLGVSLDFFLSFFTDFLGF